MSIPKSVKDQQDYTNQDFSNFTPDQIRSITIAKNPQMALDLARNQLYDSGKNQFSINNPFTNFLLSGNGLGGSNTIDTLYQLYGKDFNPLTSGNSIRDFTSNLLQSFYDPNAKTPVALTNPNIVGQTIYDVLNNTVGSAVGQSHLATKIANEDFGSQAADIANIIDAQSGVSMDPLMAQIAKNQLSTIFDQFVNSNAINTYKSFSDYLIARSADWLNKWWHITAGQRGSVPNSQDVTNSAANTGSPGGSVSAGGGGTGAGAAASPNGGDLTY